jgi:hypothetical protein
MKHKTGANIFAEIAEEENHQRIEKIVQPSVGEEV